MSRLRTSIVRALSATAVCGLLLVGVITPAAADTVSLSAAGTGADEVPAASATDKVAASIEIDAQAGSLTYTVSFQGSETPVAGHIHKGAVGVAGDVVVPLDAAVIAAGGTATVPIDKALAAAIVADPSGYYVNVHTKSHSAGAARGQLTAGRGTTPTAVNAGTGGQFAAANGGSNLPMIAILVGAVLVVLGAAGIIAVRRRRI